MPMLYIAGKFYPGSIENGGGIATLAIFGGLNRICIHQQSRLLLHARISRCRIDGRIRSDHRLNLHGRRFRDLVLRSDDSIVRRLHSL